MAHFALLDENNIVVNVVVVADFDCLDELGNESESVGVSFLQNIYGQNTRWVQTSYNNRIRDKYAGIGYSYNEQLDVFVPPVDSV